MNLATRMRTHGPLLLLQVVAAAGLAYDAKIHFHLAPAYDQIKSSTVSQGDLFRIEAWLAIAAALLVLVVRTPIAAFLAASVAGGGLVPLLVYRYYDFGSLGPLPAMYEPAWYPDKTHTAIAQAIAAVAAAVLLLALVLRSRRNTTTSPIPRDGGSEALS
ncbi:hypothetical protein [Nocardioides marmorisolisilvae]|uniref:hypothetical protein n=1 Tax=Nocardioides marmorisolisilvae TaxID=1542737 RepID=UPI00161EC69C|nr:hypothetical protein [Nocardioides marmorisolisilvae]